MDLLLKLVSAGVLNRRPVVDTSICLSDDEWMNLYVHSQEQAVTGFFLDGIGLLPEESKPSLKLRLLWGKVLLKLEDDNRKINQLAHSFSKIYRSEGLNPLLFKGGAAAYYYANPLHRCCGDIDLVFWRQFDEALDVTEKYEGNRNHEFRYDGYTIELHSRAEFFRLRRLDRRAEVFFDSWKEMYQTVNLQTTDGKTQAVVIPSEEMALCCMLLHVLRHTIESGIGLKQVCDIMAILPYVKNVDEVKKFISAFHIGYFVSSLFGFLCRDMQMNRKYLFVEPSFGYGYSLLRKIFLEEAYNDFVNNDENLGYSEKFSRAIGRVVRCLRLSPFLPEELLAYPFLQLLNRLHLRTISIDEV